MDVKVKREAVAYMVRYPEACPITVKAIISKIKEYENSIGGIEEAMKNAQNTIEHLKGQHAESIGAIRGLADLAGDSIPDGIAKTFSERYSAMLSGGTNPSEAPAGGPVVLPDDEFTKAKEAAVKSAVAKKPAAKKTAAKKAATKKAVTKKAATKKTPAKKS